jgi:outer membrane autotransporter protein
VSFRLGNVTIQPLADAFVVHDFDDHTGQLSAAFTGAPEVVFTLPYAQRSATWLDFGAGAEVALGDNVSFLARYDTTRNRSDVSYHVWTGALTVRF